MQIGCTISGMYYTEEIYYKMQVAGIMMIVFLGTLSEVLTGEALSNSILLDDILSEDYMPGTLLMLENPKGINKFDNNYTEYNQEDDRDYPKLDGTFRKAMETMDFHRY